MQQCKECRSQINEGMNFCPNCGHKKSSTEQPPKTQPQSSIVPRLESYIRNKLFIISKINEYSINSMICIIIGLLGLFIGVSIISNLEGSIDIMCVLIPIIFIIIFFSFGVYYSIEANKFKKML